ncbi:hypothetical protein K7X08_020555 [Anisodus acutangulus]|uniref:WRKY19-like zinc finger domain-containing protein n=1 Tax=Anisodus acutangulus TaxID=402998 RepID=A0A9Q1REM5_9SOLA|nr:hypothetical protein K7X08_020555 [Anisodus acutangulus]
MVEAVGVINPTAIRELKVELLSARPMVVVGGANFSAVPRVQKDALISALHMGVDAVAFTKAAAPVLPEGSQDYALDMAGAGGVRKKTAREVPKDSLDSAFHMEVDGGVSTRSALKGLKEAPCFARLTVEGSTTFCKGHGGGKRCSFEGGGICPKSVHGGTLFCVAHGGGKRCAVPECSKSARGRTDFCLRHGGGKRCKFQGCGKSAQGSTDFCKAHGGGKRCSWRPPGPEFSQNDIPCNSDKRVHGGGTLGAAILDSTSQNPGKIKEIINADDVYNNVLTSISWKSFGFNQASMPIVGSSSSVSEGRVHGGSLMAMLAGGSRHSLNSSAGTVITSEPGKPFVTPKNWT